VLVLVMLVVSGTGSWKAGRGRGGGHGGSGRGSFSLLVLRSFFGAQVISPKLTGRHAPSRGPRHGPEA
jgi:hypothetical protein